MVKKIRKILLLTTIVFFGLLTSTAFAAQLNMDEFKEEVEGINKYADYVYIIGKYAFTSAKQPLTIQDVMLAARSIGVDTADGEINTTPAFGKMTVHELEPILDDDGETTTGWKIVDNMVGDTTLALDKDNSINIEYIDYNKLVNKYHVTFKDGYEGGYEKTIRVAENTNIPTNEIPGLTRDGYKFKGWTKDGEKFEIGTTPITEDITLEAEWYKVVDISTLLDAAVKKVESTNYSAKFDADSASVIFDVTNMAKKVNDMDGTGLIDGILEILKDTNVKNLKVTCKGIEGPDNYVEFTSDMVASGTGKASQAGLKLQDLLKKATEDSSYDDITLGDLVKSGGMQLEVTLDEEKAVAKDEKNTFDIKFVEIVKQDELANSVATLISDGEGYDAEYENGTMTINIDDTKTELSTISGSNMLVALGNLLNGNASSVELAINGETVLTVDREGLEGKEYTHEWLENILKGKGITKNRDLLDKEFAVTLHLDEKSETGEGTKDITYNIVFKAKTFTVKFQDEDGSELGQQTVIQGDKATKPANEPTKDGYVFKFWTKEKEDSEYTFQEPVEGDITLTAKYKVVVDISSLLQTAVGNIKTNDDYGAEFKDNTVIFDVKNKTKKNSEIAGTGLIGDIVGILGNENVESLKVTCKGIEGPDNYVEFTKDMASGGAGPNSPAWTKFQELLKKATTIEDFTNVTLGDLVNCGDMQLDVKLYEDKAVAKDDKTQFDIKFVEIVNKDKFAQSVAEIINEGEGNEYNVTYANETITINMTNPQKELMSVSKSNMLVALGNMLKDNVSWLSLAMKTGEGTTKTILTARREELDSYNKEWLAGKLSAEGIEIEKNEDLLGKEFIVTIELDENAKRETTGGKTMIYNIVFTADKFTVKFEGGNNEPDQTVIKGELAKKPEPDPIKKGYQFQYWEKTGDEGHQYEFSTPVTEALTLKAVFKKVVETDELVNTAVKGIVGKGFTASYASGKVTIDITGIDKKLEEVEGTRIMIVLGEILKTEGVESVTVEYDGTSAKYEAITDTPDYENMKTTLQAVLTKMAATDLYGLVDKKLTVTIKVKDEAILEAKDVTAKDSTAEYTINFTSDYVRATNKQTLIEALQGKKGHIVIENDIEVDNDIEIKRSVTILSSKEENKVTRNNGGEDTHVFKISGEGTDVTLEGLQLKGASGAAVLVEDSATVTATDLKVEDEDYNKPAIAAKKGTTVKNESNFTRLDKPYKVTKGADEDKLAEIKDTRNYYIESNHSKLYTISFSLESGIRFKFFMHDEAITAPASSSKPYDNLESGKRYTFANQWKEKDGVGDIDNFQFSNGSLKATKNTTYYAKYTETDFTKVTVTKKDDLETAIQSISDGLPIIIEATGEINIDNLNIDTEQSVTLIGKGNFTLKGTITATSQVPSLYLKKLNIVGSGEGNKVAGDAEERYYIVKSEAKKFTMFQTTISNGNEDTQAYSALYLPADGVVANIQLNTFNVNNVYNTIQFEPGKAVGSGTIISNNKFEGTTNTHNHINIYAVQEGAKITIENNTFDISANAIRLSNTTGASAEFAINKNTYKETDSTTDYAGFILMQIAGSGENADDFSKYTITAKDNRGPNNKVLTDKKEDKTLRFEYYASANGTQVSDDNPKGKDKNAKVIFENS